jgi:hypothetical protein
MKKQIILAAITLLGFTASAQLGRLLKKGGGSESDDNSLPKGVEIYSTEHKDEKGVSGKYFMKYPITLASVNMMNMPKPFKVSEVTIEMRENMTGVFHFVNNEPKLQIRYESANMNEIADIGTGAMNPEVVKKTMAKCNCFRMSIRNMFMPKGDLKQAFKDGANIYVYTKDPDIILIGQPDISAFKKTGNKGFFKDRGMDFLGAQFNVISKDKAKLQQWDSTKIADALFEADLAFTGEVTSAFGELVSMPKQFVNDDAREKEYFDLIQPMAAQDKPKAWGDRMDYVYISKDWEVIYVNVGKTIPKFRFCKVIAVSYGWDKNECRYIPCTIKQNWDGTAYGPTYFAGFEGALVPVACDKTKTFKH